MNLDQAEQWANNWDTDATILLMAEYNRRGQEIARLTAIITRYETGAQQILEKISPEANR